MLPVERKNKALDEILKRSIQKCTVKLYHKHIACKDYIIENEIILLKNCVGNKIILNKLVKTLA